MKEIQKVTILGAGALGSVYASRFFEAGKFSIQFLAGRKRFDYLRDNGVTVNGKNFAIPVIHPKDECSPADLIIVALKHHHLSEAIHDLKNCVGEQTILMSVMNGIDSEAFIGSIYGIEKVLYCIAVGIDALRETSQTTYTTPGKLIFGEARNEEISPRVQRVQAALDAAKLPHETPVDMIRMLWWKFMVNVGMN